MESLAEPDIDDDTEDIKVVVIEPEQPRSCRSSHKIGISEVTDSCQT